MTERLNCTTTVSSRLFSYLFVPLVFYKRSFSYLVLLFDHLALLTLAHDARNALLVRIAVLTPLLCRVNVRGALVVRRAEHGDDGDEDGFDGVHGRPPLARVLVSVRVVSCAVKDGDADASVCVHVRVPHLGREPHGGRALRVVRGEGHDGVEESALVVRVRRSDDGDSPLEYVVVVDKSRREPLDRMPCELFQLPP